MSKLLILGNSGSGKSTLAKRLSRQGDRPHLDLDVLAWLPTDPPTRTPLAKAEKHLFDFVREHDCWVVEGCYADLLELLIHEADELIFLDLPVEQCIQNAENRPWEPHKYDSKEAQDANLSMLIQWIEQYTVRTDTFSLQAHTQFFNAFPGPKTRLVDRKQAGTFHRD